MAPPPAPDPRSEAYKVEIGAGRPRRTWTRLLQGVLFALVFNIGCLMANGSQFAFLLPLRLFPFAWARKLYDDGIRYTKGAFGNLLSQSCAAFLPLSCEFKLVQTTK
jgi:hypothetical protein